MLAAKAGILLLNPSCNEELRTYSKTFMQTLISDLLMAVKNRRCLVVYLVDVIAVIQVHGAERRRKRTIYGTGRLGAALRHRIRVGRDASEFEENAVISRMTGKAYLRDHLSENKEKAEMAKKKEGKKEPEVEAALLLHLLKGKRRMKGLQ
jgi:hypothetical protein